MGKDNPPFLSIAIASYNYGRYLTRELDAIKQQRFQDYEVVICDDCSQDDSCDIIRAYMQQNPQMDIRLLVNEQNKGLSYTKQRAMDACIGTYIMICDSDDWMAPDCLEVLCGIAAKENADRVIGEIYDIDVDGKIIQIQDHGPNPSKWLWTIFHGSIFKRSIMTENHLRLPPGTDDYHLILKFNKFADKVIFVDRPIYYWLMHVDSVGRRPRKELPIRYLYDVIDAAEEAMAFVQQNAGRNGMDQDPLDEISKIELTLLKTYYTFILMYQGSLKNKLEIYYTWHKALKKRRPDYLKNKYLRFGKKDTPLRRYARNIMCCSALLEKTHLFWAGLVVYHLASKFIYFDQ